MVCCSTSKAMIMVCCSTTESSRNSTSGSYRSFNSSLSASKGMIMTCSSTSKGMLMTHRTTETMVMLSSSTSKGRGNTTCRGIFCSSSTSSTSKGMLMAHRATEAMVMLSSSTSKGMIMSCSCTLEFRSNFCTRSQLTSQSSFSTSKGMSMLSSSTSEGRSNSTSRSNRLISNSTSRSNRSITCISGNTGNTRPVNRGSSASSKRLESSLSTKLSLIFDIIHQTSCSNLNNVTILNIGDSQSETSSIRSNRNESFQSTLRDGRQRNSTSNLRTINRGGRNSNILRTIESSSSASNSTRQCNSSRSRQGICLTSLIGRRSITSNISRNRWQSNSLGINLSYMAIIILSDTVDNSESFTMTRSISAGGIGGHSNVRMSSKECRSLSQSDLMSINRTASNSITGTSYTNFNIRNFLLRRHSNRFGIDLSYMAISITSDRINNSKGFTITGSSSIGRISALRNSGMLSQEGCTLGQRNSMTFDRSTSNSITGTGHRDRDISLIRQGDILGIVLGNVTISILSNRTYDTKALSMTRSSCSIGTIATHSNGRMLSQEGCTLSNSHIMTISRNRSNSITITNNGYVNRRFRELLCFRHSNSLSVDINYMAISITINRVNNSKSTTSSRLNSTSTILLGSDTRMLSQEVSSLNESNFMIINFQAGNSITRTGRLNSNLGFRRQSNLLGDNLSYMAMFILRNFANSSKSTTMCRSSRIFSICINIHIRMLSQEGCTLSKGNSVSISRSASDGITTTSNIDSHIRFCRNIGKINSLGSNLSYMTITISSNSANSSERFTMIRGLTSSIISGLGNSGMLSQITCTLVNLNCMILDFNTSNSVTRSRSLDRQRTRNFFLATIFID